MDVLVWADFAMRELALFAAIWFFLGALDDFAIDSIWLVGKIRPILLKYTRHGNNMVAEPRRVQPPDRRLAIFVPAWGEGAVIGEMLAHMQAAWSGRHTPQFRIYVGAYPNDPATVAAVFGSAPGGQVRLVLVRSKGPTSKADCLNRLWQAMREDELRDGKRFDAVVLQDAEDVVHPEALGVFAHHLAGAAFVQIPVVPIPSPASRYVSGHYCDEFAESHGKTLLVRSAIGAAIPAAGVGCAFSCHALERIACGPQGNGQPFATESLTEDYELGLKMAELGEKGLFVRERDAYGQWIATHSLFPGSIATAVRQKARWMTGIALLGWDRLGWSGGASEFWMRLHDRRAILAALVLCAAYLSALLALPLAGLAALELYEPAPISPTLALLLLCNAGFLVWRAIFRFAFTWRSYGLGEAGRSLPRIFVANIIAIMAARRSLTSYVALWHGRPLAWDKTSHIFPRAMATSMATRKSSYD